MHKVLAQAKAAGLGWPLPEGLDEPALHELLFGRPVPSLAGVRYRTEPDFEYLQRELKQHKHLTLRLLWEEYRGREPGGYGYSRFCDLYRKWRKKQHLVMRQEHRAGEKVFVDYAGAKVEVDDAETGRTRQAQVFVAVLGASSYTYAEASWSQELGSWIDSHVRGLPVLPGLPRGVRAGQSSLRCHARLPVPAGTEPCLPGDGAFLWRRCGPGAPEKASGQGPRRNPECSWWNAGSWRRCGTSGSRAWAS